MLSLIHIDPKTPLEELNTFIDSENDTFEQAVFCIFSHYALHNNASCKKALSLMDDLERNGIDYKIGREHNKGDLSCHV